MHNTIRRFIIVFAILASISVFSCDKPEYRQFDFWLGEWHVFTPDGKLAGHNVISLDFNKCVLREQYSTPRGYRGESINTFNQATNQWHQTWVDNSGLLLLLEGEFKNGRMVLVGDTRITDRVVVKNRITWSLNKDGTVRQLWQTKTGDKNWVTAFDGLYKKKT